MNKWTCLDCGEVFESPTLEPCPKCGPSYDGAFIRTRVTQYVDWDQYNFHEDDIGRVVIISESLGRLYGGKNEHTRTNRQFIRRNAGRRVKVAELIKAAGRYDVAKVIAGDGSTGFVRKAQLEGMIQ